MGIINLRHGRKLDGAKWFGQGMYRLSLCPAFSVSLLAGNPGVWADRLISLEILIMALTLILYIPEFYRMIRSWDRK